MKLNLANLFLISTINRRTMFNFKVGFFHLLIRNKKNVSKTLWRYRPLDFNIVQDIWNAFKSALRINSITKSVIRLVTFSLFISGQNVDKSWCYRRFIWRQRDVVWRRKRPKRLNSVGGHPLSVLRQWNPSCSTSGLEICVLAIF